MLKKYEKMEKKYNFLYKKLESLKNKYCFLKEKNKIFLLRRNNLHIINKRIETEISIINNQIVEFSSNSNNINEQSVKNLEKTIKDKEELSIHLKNKLNIKQEALEKSISLLKKELLELNNSKITEYEYKKYPRTYKQMVQNSYYEKVDGIELKCYRTNIIADNYEITLPTKIETLNSLGDEGWEIIDADDDNYFLRKPKSYACFI